MVRYLGKRPVKFAPKGIELAPKFTLQAAMRKLSGTRKMAVLLAAVQWWSRMACSKSQMFQ